MFSNIKDNKEVRKPEFILGQLVRTADIKKLFPKRDSTIYSYKLCRITEVLDHTILVIDSIIYLREIMKIYY